MKPYGLALAMTSIVGGICFAITYFLFYDAHIAEGIGALPIVASHNVAEMLERRETRRLVALKGAAAIESVKTFAIAWPIIIVYGTLIIVAVDMIAETFARTAIEFSARTHAAVDLPTFGVVLGAMAHNLVVIFLHTAPEPSAIARPGVDWALLVGTMPLKLLAGFLVGRWIGVRGGNGSWALALTVALLGALILPLAIWLIATIWSGAPGNGYAIATAAGLSISSIEFALAGLLGVWYGRRRRLAGYTEYLLSVLPPESSAALVDLAYDEAKRVT